VSALWGRAGTNRSGRVQEYYERCASGTLPAVSYVDPAFLGESQGTSGDEHPLGDVRVGQAFISDVVHAFMESRQYKRGALFIIYDEWGGFFDHVAPPRVPDLRSNRDPTKDFGQMGFRIPATVVSPFARRGHVDHTIYGFESILKLIRYRYGLPPLTPRDLYANNIARSFDFAHPHHDLPNLPKPAHIVATPCGVAADTDGALPAPGGKPPALARVKPHDLSQLYTSGYLERLGFRYRPATPATMYRHPSSMGMTP
jgi:phospholipase C